MHMFAFEPGDGTSYRVLFGRLASPTPLIPFYTVFGFAEGQDALITVVFSAPQVSFDALVGIPLDWMADTIGDWRDDWRAQLPMAALG
jgi:hypothetical protein